MCPVNLLPMCPVHTIVSNYGDVMFFSSKEHAEGYLEAIDVENGEYVGFDADGNELKISARGGVVFIDGTEVNRESEVRALLISFFRNVGVPNAWLESAGLSDLVMKGKEFLVF